MFPSLLALVPWVFTAGGGSGKEDRIPKGISSHSFVVDAVHQDALTVIKSDEFGFRTAKLKLHLAKDSQFDLVEAATAGGKSTVSVKRIALQDLFPSQPINVILFSDGNELTVLRVVASSGGVELARTVRDLGGTATRVAWPKDRNEYTVNLRGAKITDAELAALSLIPGMADLDLSFTAVTDKGVASLAGYAKLNGLNLTGAKVTDAAVDDLLRIPNLTKLMVARTAMSEAALERLIQKKRFFTLCKVALGDAARFRVFEEFREGERQFNYLMINDTYYGRYNVGKLFDRREATTYYHRLGPVGQVMGKLEWFTPPSVLDYPSDVRMPASLVGMLASHGQLPAGALVDLWSEPPLAVVRLNVGTHAAYGRPYQHIHFYNSSPELTKMSMPGPGQPVHFGFIRDALERGCRIAVFDGPERSTLAKQAPRNFYRAMFLDMTVNDLRDINTALMTREALADMMECLTDDGVACFHTSHRYHDLVPPIVDAAASLKLAWKQVNDVGDRDRRMWAHFGSEWVMVARKAADLRHLTSVKSDERKIDWSVPPSTGKHVWRDGETPNLKALARTGTR